MKNEQSQEINFNIFLIIWGAILWSCCIFVGLTYFQFQGSILSLEDFINASPLSFILLFIAFSSFFGAEILFKTLIKSSKIEATASEQELHQKYFVPFVIRIIMYEACTILGLALSFMESKSLILPFFIMSLIGFLTSFPTKVKIRNAFLRR